MRKFIIHRLDPITTDVCFENDAVLQYRYDVAIPNNNGKNKINLINVRSAI